MRTLLTFVIVLFALPALAADVAPRSTFEKVFSRKELTCASFVFNNLFERDPNTGQRTGFFADVMTEVGKRLQIAVTFEEIGSFASGFEELKSGRYDMICASLASFPANYGKMLFSRALFYDPIYIWGAADRDYTAITSVADLNDPKWRLAAMDGELGGIFAPVIMPKVTMDMVSQQAGAPGMLLDLQTHKADVVMLTKAAAQAFTLTNPGKLQQIMPVPVAQYPIRFVFKPEDLQLKTVFDMVIEDMAADGTLQELIRKYHLQ